MSGGGGGRAGVFDDDGDDLGDFRARPTARPEQVREVAEGAGFRSRDPRPQARPEASPATLVSSAAGDPGTTGGTVPAAAGGRELRRYRTGRNQQLNLKVRAEDAAAFYAIADGQGWVLGETFARAIAALQRELAGG